MSLGACIDLTSTVRPGCPPDGCLQDMLGPCSPGGVLAGSFVVIDDGVTWGVALDCHMKEQHVPALDRDLRCHCGRMVARIENRGIVIKCNRCGEFVVIDLATIRKLLKTYESTL